jgi:hypothetical protein
MRVIHVGYYKDGHYGLWSDMKVSISDSGEYRTKSAPDEVYPCLHQAIVVAEGYDSPECPVIVELSDPCHVLAFGFDFSDIKE